MRVPRFLFENEDLTRLERIAGPLRKSEKWLTLSGRDFKALEILFESESPLAAEERRRFLFKLTMVDKVSALYEKAETVEQKAIVLGSIMALHALDPNLPMNLMDLLEP